MFDLVPCFRAVAACGSMFLLQNQNNDEDMLPQTTRKHGIQILAHSRFLEAAE